MKKLTSDQAADAAFGLWPIEAATDTDQADARALWAVRVLDAWADAAGPADTRYWSACTDGNAKWFCDTQGTDWTRLVKRSDTPDAARLAAAESVYPTLPADVRAKLGVMP